jgi:hypothetical protein
LSLNPNIRDNKYETILPDKSSCLTNRSSGAMKVHMRSRAYASVARTFEERAAATKISRLKANLLKRANRELAEQAKQLQVIR